MNEQLTKFTCRFFHIIRCKNSVYRDSISDLFDYPYCEQCQKKEVKKVTRLDDGQYNKLL